MTDIAVRDAYNRVIAIPISEDPTTSTKQDTLNAAVGTAAADAWSGSGSGVVIAVLKAIWNAVAGLGWTASGKTPVTGTLVSSTLTTVFTPLAGRGFYLELTGTGSVSGTAVYLCNDGSTYAPNVVATNGGSPIVMDSIAYNGGTQNGVRIALQVDQASKSVKFSPGTVTGTVNYAFVQ